MANVANAVDIVISLLVVIVILVVSVAVVVYVFFFFVCFYKYINWMFKNKTCSFLPVATCEHGEALHGNDMFLILKVLKCIVVEQWLKFQIYLITMLRVTWGQRLVCVVVTSMISSMCCTFE